MIKKLLSQDCKNRFMKYRSTCKESHTHLEVLSGFLDMEYDRQKDLASLLKSDAGMSDQKRDNQVAILSVICHNYGQKGHYQPNCPRGSPKRGKVAN